LARGGHAGPARCCADGGSDDSGAAQRDSWQLAELGRFALPGVTVTLVSKQLQVRFPTRDEAAAFAIPVECALTETYCAMVIGAPFAVRAGLIVRAPGFTPVELHDTPLRIRSL
jgi:hypothetical protein